MKKVVTFFIMLLILSGCETFYGSSYIIQYHSLVNNKDENQNIGSVNDILKIIDTTLNSYGFLKKQNGMNEKIIYSGSSVEKSVERRVKVEITINVESDYILITNMDLIPGSKSNFLENIDRELRKTLREKGIFVEHIPFYH